MLYRLYLFKYFSFPVVMNAESGSQTFKIFNFFINEFLKLFRVFSIFPTNSIVFVLSTILVYKPILFAAFSETDRVSSCEGKRFACITVRKTEKPYCIIDEQNHLYRVSLTEPDQKAGGKRRTEHMPKSRTLRSLKFFIRPYKKIVEIYYLVLVNYMKIFDLVIIYDIKTMWNKPTTLTTKVL